MGTPLNVGLHGHKVAGITKILAKTIRLTCAYLLNRQQLCKLEGGEKTCSPALEVSAKQRQTEPCFGSFLPLERSGLSKKWHFSSN